MRELFQFDMEAFRAIHLGLHSPFLDPIFFVFSYLGLGWVQFLLTLFLLRSQRHRRMVVPLLTTIVISGGILAQILKNLVLRDRPSNLVFALPQEHIFMSSFPSGHTTTSFAVATMILLLTWKTPQVKWGWISLFAAFLVGVSRVYRGVHWPTDAMGGACLGVFSACAICVVFQWRGWWPSLGEPELR